MCSCSSSLQRGNSRNAEAVSSPCQGLCWAWLLEVSVLDAVATAGEKRESDLSRHRHCLCLSPRPPTFCALSHCQVLLATRYPRRRCSPSTSLMSCCSLAHSSGVNLGTGDTCAHTCYSRVLVRALDAVEYSPVLRVCAVHGWILPKKINQQQNMSERSPGWGPVLRQRLPWEPSAACVLVRLTLASSSLSPAPWPPAAWMKSVLAPGLFLNSLGDLTVPWSWLCFQPKMGRHWGTSLFKSHGAGASLHVSSGELAAARHPGTGWQDAGASTTAGAATCRGFPRAKIQRPACHTWDIPSSRLRAAGVGPPQQEPGPAAQAPGCPCACPTCHFLQGAGTEQRSVCAARRVARQPLRATALTHSQDQLSPPSPQPSPACGLLVRRQGRSL